jgi:small subunit ribosomal protein S16
MDWQNLEQSGTSSTGRVQGDRLNLPNSLKSSILKGWDSCGLVRACIGLPNIPATRSERILPVLMIRLARFGARKQPYYRVVVIEKRLARNGRSIEIVGTYNPRTNPATVDLKRERIEHWVGQGAQLSERVGKLLAKHAAPVAVAA